MPVKLVSPILLSSQQYAELSRLARKEDRNPVQQARHILKTVLEEARKSEDQTVSA